MTHEQLDAALSLRNTITGLSDRAALADKILASEALIARVSITTLSGITVSPLSTKTKQTIVQATADELHGALAEAQAEFDAL